MESVFVGDSNGAIFVGKMAPDPDVESFSILKIVVELVVQGGRG